jgi:hypothetical protein
VFQTLLHGQTGRTAEGVDKMGRLALNVRVDDCVVDVNLFWQTQMYLVSGVSDLDSNRVVFLQSVQCLPIDTVQ